MIASSQNLSVRKRRNNICALTFDEAFMLVEKAAINGERCPLSTGKGSVPGLFYHHFKVLSREGRIRVEISSGNWRQVHILTGPHAGACTAPNPKHDARVYRDIGTSRRKVTTHKNVDGGFSVTINHQPTSREEIVRTDRLHGYAARDLTGTLMGDPPVGHSALDRRAR